jgi:hypothetical protein
MRLFSFFRQEYTPLSDGNESPPAFAADFSVFFVTPLQIWLGRLVSQVWKAGSIEDDWLPRFSCNSSHLRAVAAALGKNHHAKLAFLGQREIIGMLLLGAMFEVRAVRHRETFLVASGRPTT